MKAARVNSLVAFVMWRDCMVDTDKLNIINCGSYMTVVNLNGNYENHCHIDTYDTALMFVRLVEKKRVPDSDHLRKSALRVSTNPKYIEKVNIKIAKDKDRTRYFNVNRGITR